jgi:ureidoglycolate hydrolase
MDEMLLGIREHTGEGYLPLIDSGEWRVAVLRFLDELLPERIDSMERHLNTDEVFVLMSGRGVLILGGNGDQADEISFWVMEFGKVYNVKRYTWHTILLSLDASVLLVENKDTSRHNSEYSYLMPEQRHPLLQIARGEGYHP